MDLSDQPPPNAPAPPPSIQAVKSRNRYRILWIFSVISFVVVVAFSRPITWDSRRMNALARAHEASNNFGEVHRALFEFDVEYGSFPNAATVRGVRDATGSTIRLGGTSSNDYFRQLLAQGLGDEKIFYAPGELFRKPDGRITGVEALEKGECGVAYVVGLSISDDSSMPLVMAPVLPYGKGFNPKPFRGNVVILRIDGSATSYPIRKDGKIDLGGGAILDPAAPMWKGKPLTIAWPE